MFSSDGTLISVSPLWDTDRTSLDSVKWDGRVLVEQQHRKDIRFYSVEKKINTSTALDFLFTWTSWTLSWDVAQLAHHHLPVGSTFQHHNSKSICPNVRLWWQLNRRIPWPALIRHWKRPFLLFKETGMQKWARMLVEIGKAFVDPSAMMTQMRGHSDFWSLPPLKILCWWTLLVITKHPEDGPGTAQMDNTTTRLITF